MDKKLKKAAENIRMPDELKSRIITECRNIPQDEQMAAEHVFTVEHAPKRNIKRTVAAFAACAVIAGGVGTMGVQIARNGGLLDSDTEMSDTVYTPAPFGDLHTDHIKSLWVRNGSNYRDTRHISDNQNDLLADFFNSYEWVENDAFNEMDDDDIWDALGDMVCCMEFEDQPDPTCNRSIRIFENDILGYIDPDKGCTVYYNIDTALFLDTIYDIANSDNIAYDENAATLTALGLEIQYITLESGSNSKETAVRDVLNAMTVIPCDISECTAEDGIQFDFNGGTAQYTFNAETVSGYSLCVQIWDAGYMLCELSTIDPYNVDATYYKIDYPVVSAKLNEILSKASSENALENSGHKISEIYSVCFNSDVDRAICSILNEMEAIPADTEKAELSIIDVSKKFLFEGKQDDDMRIKVNLYDSGYMEYAVFDGSDPYMVTYFTIDFDAVSKQLYDAMKLYSTADRISVSNYRGVKEHFLNDDEMTRVKNVIEKYNKSLVKAEPNAADDQDVLGLVWEIYDDHGSALEEVLHFSIYPETNKYYICRFNDVGECLDEAWYAVDGERMKNDILNIVDPNWTSAPFPTLFKMTDKIFISANVAKIDLCEDDFDLMISDGTVFDFKAILNDEQAQAMSYALWGWDWDNVTVCEEFPAMDDAALLIYTNSNANSDLPALIYIYDDGTIITANDNNGKLYDIKVYSNVGYGYQLIRTIEKALS